MVGPMNRMVGPGAFALVLGVAPLQAEEATRPVERAAPARPAAERAAPEKDAALGADMTETLRKSGFTDLHVYPGSILVRAKDKAGNPVAMVLNPKSMTEIVTLDPHSGSAAGGDGGAPPLSGSSTFTTVLASERLASTLIGLKVRDPADRELATIKDLAIDHGGIQAYILVVGGLLGLGDRFVAVAPAAITIAYDQVANHYTATMDATAEQIKAAPDFTYEGAFKATRD